MSAGSVSEVGRADQASALADAHLGHTLVPLLKKIRLPHLYYTK